MDIIPGFVSIAYLTCPNLKNRYAMSDTKSASHTSNVVYGLGFIGAAIYYIQMATGFWAGVVGFLKAIVWPAFLVYDALRYLGTD